MVCADNAEEACSREADCNNRYVRFITSGEVSFSFI